MLCPKCKTDNAHRSHRSGLIERLASLFACYPYRCRDCGYRFLRFRYKIPGVDPAEHTSATEREIRSIRVRIQWQRKRREILLYGSGILLFLIFLYYITRPDRFN